MGQEDALKGGVYWLVEPLDGKRIHRLVPSTHPQGAQALLILTFLKYRSNTAHFERPTSCATSVLKS
ncbi:MAG TPA: hypothetical protein VF043_14390 [Ktedonobacteraceae bacterium]